MVTRYDTSEVRDTAFEMMHVQAPSMSMRGFALHKETGKLMPLLRGHALLKSTMSYILRLGDSSIYFIARDLGPELGGVEQLNDATESEDLCKLHTKLQGLADPGPSCPPDEGSSDSSDSENFEVEITTKKTVEEFTALVQIARKIMTFPECEESEVVRSANFVTVTPAMAGTQPYSSFNASHAQAAMHRKDGLMVYGNSMRPIFAVGDERQLPPTLLTMGEMYPDGAAVNRFGQDAKLSWLS
ncbi:hypothetical protein BFJ72_g8479 [Fusarium proliferatum]|uniref:DNA2/NAM7 helicase helicase domain-containing protein n=1 Tax=Gibberella intermedia TaxID=948311 RepID=A0A420T2H0_GIBIN|nr:hypothetical protein BFJ72_g8479 [Fusarium proliferatum]